MTDEMNIEMTDDKKMINVQTKHLIKRRVMIKVDAQLLFGRIK